MSTSTAPVEQRRLYQQVADQIRSLIAEKGIREGGRLPPERDLAQQLGVSRPSLREALIALEIEGTVDIRMGSGIYYLGAPETPTKQHGDSPNDLMEARIAVETAAVSMACARAQPQDFERLRNLLHAMKVDIDANRHPLDNDRIFHIEIASLSGNSVLSRLVGDMFDARFSPIFTQYREHFDNRQSWLSAYEEHVVIVDAMEARDSLRASGHMAAHLLASLRRWERET
ncbi:FadR/GntR family transcriptional regulator [Aureimonas altamirensis]|jgi:GntR family transcriptional regulator, transcriptional repressor for pyruvate dehydrogenase complex|nr:FadR/GntR family transcriptional regulator [Aureimonas altamirensis]SHI38545.1 DNA-binding transcriptional regulator, FadR family [Aureimonas altamirensis DSM 21988]